MNKNTNNVRRYPRTMAQAFGPYTDNVLHPMRERRPEPAEPVRIAPESPPASNNSIFRRILIAVTGH